MAKRDDDNDGLTPRARRLTAHLPEVGRNMLPKTRPAMRGAKRAGVLAQKTAKPSLQRFGFQGGDIIRDWNEIAGERLKLVTRPQRIKRMPDGNVLVLKVARAAAMEVQHKAPELIDRANQLTGAKLIRIEIIQGPIG